jgi:adenosine kinase
MESTGGSGATKENNELDLFVIGNPLLDICVWENDTAVLDKYKLKLGDACLASEEQMPIYEELLARQDHKTCPGGAGLNSCRGARFALKKAGYETKGVAYFGCIGKDAPGETMEKTLVDADIKPYFDKSEDTPTGTCAAVVKGKERALCANIAASAKYTMEHLTENWSVLESARFVYLTGFFITSNDEALKKVSRHCAEVDKPFLFNIAAPFLLFINFDAVMDAIEHADYVFCNEEEASTIAEKLGLKAEDRVGAAKAICNYKKANTKRSRTVIITQQAEPVIVCTKDGENVKEFQVQIPPVESEKIIDSNGAGDALVGGFLAGMIQNKSMEDCLKDGIALSAQIIQTHGCVFE